MRSATERRTAVVLVAVTAAAVSLGWGSSAHAAGGPTPTFGRPVISGIQGWGFEPNLRIDTHGRMYMSVPNTASSSYSFIWRSLDHGQTWKWVPNASPYAGKTATCAGGGDTELATDSADNLYFNDLTLANFSTARSSDQGTTFTPPNCTSVVTSPDDRQWYAVDGDPTHGGALVLAYNVAYSLANPGAGQCSPSNQLTLERSPVPGDVTGQSAGVLFAPPQGVTTLNSCDEGIMGAEEVHNYNGVRRVLVPHDNAALNQVRVGRCDLVDYTVSPTGFGSCVDKTVASFPTAITGGNFPVLTIDNSGDAYMVWEQAEYDYTGVAVTGDCLLYMSVSHDQGDTWSQPQQIPTPGLHNNVYAWIAAGDHGRVDAAWYGTDSVPAPGAKGGPSSAEGDWGLYFAQTLDGGSTWTAPQLASEHFVHRGHMFTLLGDATGGPLGPSLDAQRTATGDFMQLRIGPYGEANIVYTDSNHAFEGLGEAAFVRQNGGSSVLADPTHAVVPATPAPAGSVTDPTGDATLDAAATTSANIPNLDITGARATLLDATHYRFTINVADLTSLTPAAAGGGTDLVWQLSWQRPEGRNATGGGDPNGGHHFFAYMESNNGATPTFWDGDAAFFTGGNGALRTYPGAHQVTGSYTPTAPGTITIDVPIADVAPTIPIDETLYSVTAASETLPQPASTAPSLSGIGGVPFNLIDAAAPFDFTPTQPAAFPEGNTVLLLLVPATVAVVAGGRRRRRAARAGAS